MTTLTPLKFHVGVTNFLFDFPRDFINFLIRFFWLLLPFLLVHVFMIKLECNFSKTGDPPGSELCTYICLANRYISETNTTITSLDGHHINNKSNIDVDGLKIYNQNVTTLPSDMKKTFPRLKELIIGSCGLKVIDRIFFENVSTLIILFLRLPGNQISSIPDDTFYDLSQLLLIDLRVNAIKTLPVNLLAMQPHLRNFHFDYNDINEIPKGLFKHNINVSGIYMNGNKLSVIDTEDFLNKKQLRYLALNGNQCINKNYFRSSNDEFHRDFLKDSKELKVKCSKKEHVKKGKSSQLNVSLVLTVVSLLNCILQQP
jgi:Leucine-rich repeat (LRR) protein